MFKEIGLIRMVRYLIFELWDVVFQLLPFAPLTVLWIDAFGGNVSFSAIIGRVHFMNLDRTGLSGLTIGRRAYVGVGVILDLAGRVTLADHATISPGAVVLSHFSVGFSEHPLIKYYPKSVSQTQIKQGSFIGANATILPGITIGDRSMVAAGSVVTRNVAPQTMVAGIPATVKKKFE